ncbi:hypothetical protein [Actinomadura madurae]|uniref:hypothetical protein n=1 Tax=Actinomadura madurae TaxID=1993 RepID=UPI0011BDC3A9|nr:hypothetical protein [Actinomadura madurae]MCP9951243.1 hypothetical protein [Actinomadura madurae]MCP9968012.1 hypothetical protein [Actinomadura madurae]MCP9980470.1 hypothetical protein [Actinomadura madurae]MCQ0008013.1 hypothetical protein [Actinomadura madurae]MCQ0016671.1 hypothetical protein [Actinomadura madurae]
MLVIAGGSVAELQALLDEAVRFNCRRATHVLGEVLRGQGVAAQVYGQVIVAVLACGVRRTIVAGRGLCRWTSGVVVGGIGAAAERVLCGLGVS